MSYSKTVLIAIGGGELAECTEVLEKFFALLEKIPEARIAVLTVATDGVDGAVKKYNSLFRSRGFRHVNVVDVSIRSDAFDSQALEKIRNADVLYFTGGDQLHVTSLLGGSPLHSLILEKCEKGVIIAGISAGASMMSSSMIISGRSDTAPRFGCLEIAPGMNLITDSVIDSHFSERGRHGRLLCALAHYPQALGIGIDERTAIFVRGSEMKVVGESTVTIMDGSRMKHNDLPYSNNDEPIAIFDVHTHILRSGYKFDLKKRAPVSPSLRTLKASN